MVVLTESGSYITDSTGIDQGLIFLIRGLPALTEAERAKMVWKMGVENDWHSLLGYMFSPC